MIVNGGSHAGLDAKNVSLIRKKAILVELSAVGAVCALACVLLVLSMNWLSAGSPRWVALVAALVAVLVVLSALNGMVMKGQAGWLSIARSLSSQERAKAEAEEAVEAAKEAVRVAMPRAARSGLDPQIQQALRNANSSLTGIDNLKHSDC